MIVGSARLFSLCSSVFNLNEWGLASSRYGCTIGAKKNGVKFFFKFFFSSGVGAWVWGAWGVGRWVWGGGCGAAGYGWGGLDGGGIGIRLVGLAGWNGESSSQGVPIPDSDCRLG